MARTRKAFLAAASSLGAGLALTGQLEAQTPPVSPIATPTASPSPSPAAHELALRMRKFDPALTDAEIDTIAAGIDQGIDSGKSIRRHHPLQNGEGPSPEFAIEA